jgi:hypothetical protein
MNVESMDKRAYVYTIVVDGIVRYIGKGSTTRVRAHMRIVKGIARRRAAGEAVRASHFYNRLTKAWVNGAEIEEIIIVDQLTDQEAYQREIVEIGNAPQGQLWNYWSGGEGGNKGYPLPPEQRAKIAETNRKTWRDPQLVADQSVRMKLAWSRPEYRDAVKAGFAANPHSARKSEAAKRRWNNPDFRQKMHAIHSSTEFKTKRSEATKRGWETRCAKVIGGDNSL